VSNENDVAMPEGWPKNELIKDHVIIPPASSIKEVRDRETDIKNDKIEAYDW
jgi:peroxiredoxin 2/4